MSFITEILKAHRQHYLYTQHNMMQVPLINPELEERFATQIMCTYVEPSIATCVKLELLQSRYL